MNAMSLMATLGLDSREYESGLSGATKKAHSFASTVTKILGSIAIGAAVKKSFDAIVDLTKTAVKAYGEYEQLVGGVNKLFGNGGQSFEEYQEQAATTLYKMGQRGNDIMELQRKLNQEGANLVVDGIYGPKTQAAFDAYAKAGGEMVKTAYENSNKAAEAMQENAWNAAQKVGMDANTYMRSVTGFSAALINSVGGDTKKAVDLADMAMQDIADNANTYGKYSVEELAGVYQALARGSYQTLDNLNLGFGGTKEGMQALINKANEYRKTQGRTANLTIDSYADIVTAIHEVQDQMKIAGTTEHEAMTTIQGSLNATKAEWNNLMIAFAKGDKTTIRTVTKNMVSSARNLVSNVVPRVSTALSSISDFIGEIAPVIASEVPGIIADVGPAFLNAVGSLIGSVVKNIPGMLGSISGVIKKVITGDSDASWAEVGAELWKKIKAGINEAGDWLKELVGFSPDASWEQVGSQIWEYIKKGFDDVVTFFTGLYAQAAIAITNIPWESVGQWIGSKIRTAVEAIKGFLVELLTGEETDAESSASKFEALGKSIKDYIKAGLGAISDLIRGFLEGFNGEQVSLDLFAIAMQIVGLLRDFIVAGAKVLYETGDELITNLAAGIVNAIPGLEIDVDTVKGIINGILTFAMVMKIGAVGSKLIETMKGIFTALAAAMSAHPVLAAIGLVIAGLVFLWNKSESFRTAVINIYETVSEKVSEAYEAIKSKFESIRDSISSVLSEIEENPILKTIADVIAAPFRLAYSIIDVLFATFSAIFTVQWDIVSEKAQGMFEIIKQPFVDAWDAIKLIWDAVSKYFEDIFAAIKSGKSLGEILSVISQPFIDAYNAIVSAWDGAVTWAENTFGGIANAVHSAFDSIVGWVQNAIDKVKEFLGIKEKADSALYDTSVVGENGPQMSKSGSGGGVVGSGGGRKHASAMYGGEILHGITPFGIDGNGTIHYGGEAGVEAVVGVNSLDQMIQRSVENAVGAVLSRLDTIIGGQNANGYQVVLDSGALVGGMVRKMDSSLYDISAWKEGGRA